MEQPRARGWRGTIYTQQIDGKTIATKRANDTEKQAAISKEIQILSYLHKQQADFVPVLIDSGIGEFSYQRIEGVHFIDVRNRSSPSLQISLAQQLLDKAFKLDTLGVVHGELIRPTKNVLVDKQQNIRIIDFERGHMGDSSGKNMRSLSQWFAAQGLLTINDCKHLGKLTRDEIYAFLSAKISRTMDSKLLEANIRIGILVVIDQLTKRIFFQQQRLSDTWLFTPVFNTGSGWGLQVPLSLILILTFAVLVFIGVALLKKRYHPWLLILLAAGTLGNGIDRIIWHGVRDFIDLHVWPVFNMADIFLTGAICILIYSLITSTYHRMREYK